MTKIVVSDELQDYSEMEILRIHTSPKTQRKQCDKKITRINWSGRVYTNNK